MGGGRVPTYLFPHIDAVCGDGTGNRDGAQEEGEPAKGQEAGHHALALQLGADPEGGRKGGKKASDADPVALEEKEGGWEDRRVEGELDAPYYNQLMIQLIKYV